MHAGRGVFAFVVASIALAAADGPQPPVAPESEDTIAKARRDLEAIKAMRGTAAEAQKADLPHFNVPEMNVGGGAPARPGNVAPNAKSKSPNWLVDAMAKKTDKAPEAKNSTDGQLENLEHDLVLGSTAEEKPARGPAGEPTRRDQNEAGTASANPLTAYMASWMTPADYKLLKPSLQVPDGIGSIAPAIDDRGAFSPTGSTGSVIVERSPSPMSGTKTNAVPAENPFLQAQALLPNVTSPPAPIAPNGATSAGAKPGGLLALPPPLSPPRQSPASRPDFLRAGDEAKYFKPLKKF